MLYLYLCLLPQQNYILTVTCPARAGVVAFITSFLADHDCYLPEMAQYDDETTGKFFCRLMFRLDSEKSPNIESLRQGFASIATGFEMIWTMVDSAPPMKVLIMVSKADHCLNELLYRNSKGELSMDVTTVASNHADLRPMVEREGIRFIHLPMTKGNKLEQEERLLEIIEETESELVILARYMQILSNDLCAALAGKCINIHHSFLPGFKGARPYHQAFERGVKLIGSTAHYVTADLDEGPIISQVVETVDHTQQPEELVTIGRGLENRALARAVRLHIERRVFVDKNKTVIFS